MNMYPPPIYGVGDASTQNEIKDIIPLLIVFSHELHTPRHSYTQAVNTIWIDNVAAIFEAKFEAKLTCSACAVFLN